VGFFLGCVCGPVTFVGLGLFLGGVFWGWFLFFVFFFFLGTGLVGGLGGLGWGGSFSAVVPEINGRAWVTGTAQYMLDPADPFPHGFLM
jgi:hypothetical protein